MSPGLSTRLLATQSDERLIALARDGHERAFEALVLRYRRPLLRYCRRLPLGEARVEDVLQQALLQAWVALQRGADVREPRAWLYRIVHNTAVNALRDGAGAALVSGYASSEAEGHQLEASIEPDLAGGLAIRETLAEVAALPPMQREVMVLTAVGGHSHEEVASVLGITDGAVRGLLYRARATLRAAVTAVTPPPLLLWLAGSSLGGQPSERVAEAVAGGGTAGIGGLLVKGGVLAVTAGTLITAGTGVLHTHSTPRRERPRTTATAAGAGATGAGSAGGAAQGLTGHATPTRHGVRGAGRAGHGASGDSTSGRGTHHTASGGGPRIGGGGPKHRSPSRSGAPHGTSPPGGSSAPQTSQTVNAPAQEPSSSTPQTTSGASEGSAGGGGNAGGNGGAGGGAGAFGGSGGGSGSSSGSGGSGAGGQSGGGSSGGSGGQSGGSGEGSAGKEAGSSENGGGHQATSPSEGCLSVGIGPLGIKICLNH